MFRRVTEPGIWICVSNRERSTAIDNPHSTSRSCSGAGKVTSLAFSVGDRRARELSLILRIGGFVVVVVMVVMVGGPKMWCTFGIHGTTF